MARPRTYDTEQVLEGAIEVFRERGYEATRLPELVERLGICRQSLYTTFGGKRGLYIQALERWGRREIDAKLVLLNEASSALEGVRTIIRGLADMATHCPGEGCLTARALVELRDDPEALTLIEAQVARLEDGFAEALQRAANAGELAPSAQPRRLARALITGCYGVGLLARLPSSGARIADGVSVLLDVLDAAATKP